MRIALYSVALLHAATVSAYSLESVPQSDNFAQIEAQTEGGNLVEALSKVISSLSTNPPAGAAAAGDGKTDSAPAAPAATGVAAGPPRSGAGTNIAVTTATDQHINIFVPEDPQGKVTIKKTNQVKVVESDNEKEGSNDATKRALMAKVKTSLSKAAIKGDSESEDEADDKDGAIAAMEKKIKAAKKKSEEMAAKLKKSSMADKKKNLAQTGAVDMTEEEIMQLAQDGYYFAETDSESGSDSDSASSSASDSGSLSQSNSESESEGGSDEMSASQSDSQSESDSESESESENESENESESDCEVKEAQLDAEEIFEFAQVEADPTVKMVPQVHVQVTRIGPDGKAIRQ